MPADRTVKLNIRVPEEMYKELQKLRSTLRLQDDSKTVRFCITYTMSSINKLDKDIIAQTVAEAVGKILFNNLNNKQ